MLAEFARPGRAGDVSALVSGYTEGFDPLTRRPDGEIDTDVLQFVIDEQSHKLAAAEVAAALHVSPITARRRVTAAVELTAELPGTHAALAAGRIDRARAWVIADRTAVLDRETRGLVEDRILPIAADRTPGRLRELVDRAVIAVDPEAAANRGRKARADRRVEHQPLPDGMGRLQAFLPADGAVSVFTLVDLLAGATAGLDERGVDARRADALTDIADALLTDGYCDLTGLIQPVADAGRGPEPGTARADQTTGKPTAAAAIADPPEVAAQASDASEADGSDAPDTAASTPTANSGPSDDDAEAYGITAAEAHAATASESSGPGATGRRSRVLTRHGRRPHQTVTLSLATLAGLDQLPGALAGHGAVTADLARAIAASLASINTVIVDLLKTLGGWSSTLGPWHDLIWTSPTGHRYQAPPRVHPARRVDHPRPRHRPRQHRHHRQRPRTPRRLRHPHRATRAHPTALRPTAQNTGANAQAGRRRPAPAVPGHPHPPPSTHRHPDPREPRSRPGDSPTNQRRTALLTARRRRAAPIGSAGQPAAVALCNHAALALSMTSWIGADR